MGFNNFEQAQFQVLQCLIPASGTYGDMKARSFTMNAMRENIDALQHSTGNFTNFTQESILNANADGRSLMSMNAQAMGSVDIVDNWDSQRRLILLILQNVNTQTVYMVSGFMSADFISGYGSYNAYASVRFDTVLTLNPDYDFNGNISGYSIADSDNIIGANSITDLNGMSQINNIQRPSDIFGKSAIQNMFSDHNGPMVTHTADTMNRTVHFSQHRNSITNDYLTRSLKAFNDSAINNGDGALGFDGDQMNSVLNSAATSSAVAENAYTTASIINTLLVNASSLRNATTTWGELTALLPELNSEQVTRVIPDDSGVEHHQGIMAWGNRYEAPIAAEIAAAVRSLMIRYGITYVGFQMATSSDSLSMDYSGGATFQWTYTNPTGGPDARLAYAGLPEQQLFAAFETYMRTVVLPRAANGNRVMVSVQANAFKDMTLSLALGTEEPVTATAGCFAAGLWSPVNVADIQGADNMACNMLQLFGEINKSRQGMTPAQNQPMTAIGNSGMGLSDFAINTGGMGSAPMGGGMGDTSQQPTGDGTGWLY